MQGAQGYIYGGKNLLKRWTVVLKIKTITSDAYFVHEVNLNTKAYTKNASQ